MPTRLIIVVTALSLLAGCETEPARSTNQLPVASEEAAEHGDSHCRAVARQRADDAWANGYGLQIQSSVSAEAYQGCIVQHAGSPE